MKKLLIWAMMLTGIMLVSCSKAKDEENEPGSIYGVVTKINSTEVLKGIQIKLYKGNDHQGAAYWPLLLTTTTFEDGHYEFSNLDPGVYGVQPGYHEYYDKSDITTVRVESGRQARIDLQVYVE